MYSSCKRSIRRNTNWSAIYISLKGNIPKFDTVLLHSNWSSLRRKYLRKVPTDLNALSCGPKTWKISGILDDISPARHPQKSSQHARACATGDGAICSKNRIIVPYHGDNPNTRNGARLLSPSPIMAPTLRHLTSSGGSIYWISSCSSEVKNTINRAKMFIQNSEKATRQQFCVGFPTLCRRQQYLFIYLFLHESKAFVTWFLLGV